MSLDQPMLFAEDSPASPGPSPGSDEARRTTAISGRKCAELLPLLNLDLSLQKMCRALMTQNSWASTECFLTWKDSPTQSRRLKFRLVPSMPRTGGQDCGLWPTHTVSSGAQTAENPTPGQTGGTTLQGAVKALWPTARANKRGPPDSHGDASMWATPAATESRQGFQDRTRGKKGTQESLTTQAMWSTPRSSDGAKGGPNQSFGAGGQPLPSQAAKMWGTPRDSDGMKHAVKAIPSGERGRLEQQVAHGQTAEPSTAAVSGSLNPTFVEWMMGFPENWTET